jgi:ethanolamine utilization microcompartment shell protein EutL
MPLSLVDAYGLMGGHAPGNAPHVYNIFDKIAEGFSANMEQLVAVVDELIYRSQGLPVENEALGIIGASLKALNEVTAVGKGVEACPVAMTEISFGKKATRYSATQLHVNMSQAEAIDNLAANGYSKAISKSGVATVMSNGERTYTFYPASTGGGIEHPIPHKSVSIFLLRDRRPE